MGGNYSGTLLDASCFALSSATFFSELGGGDPLWLVYLLVIYILYLSRFQIFIKGKDKFKHDQRVEEWTKKICFINLFKIILIINNNIG